LSRLYLVTTAVFTLDTVFRIPAIISGSHLQAQAFQGTIKAVDKNTATILKKFSSAKTISDLTPDSSMNLAQKARRKNCKAVLLSEMLKVNV